MNSWLPHAIFAIILAASVAGNVRGTNGRTGVDNIEPAIIAVALSHGLTLSEETTAKELARTLVFHALGCGEPILITLLHVTLEEEALAPTVPHHYVAHYVYLDRTWNSPDHLALFFRQKTHKVLVLLGLTQYVLSDWMLRVASPLHCEFADTIDWRPVWNRDDVTSRP